MSIIVDTKYTINVLGKEEELHDSIIYNNNFSTEGENSVPTGWTTSAGTGADPRIRISNRNSNLRVLAISGSTVSHSAVDDSPANFTGQLRWVKYSNADVKGSVKIKFNFMAGAERTSIPSTTPPVNEFGLERPETSDELYFQYSTDDTNWTTVQTYINTDEVYTNVFTTATHSICVPNGVRVYFRWMAEVSGFEYDQWGINNVVISKNIPPPQRLMFLGAPNIRKQTASQRYYTFLGKQQI